MMRLTEVQARLQREMEELRARLERSELETQYWEGQWQAAQEKVQDLEYALAKGYCSSFSLFHSNPFLAVAAAAARPPPTSLCFCFPLPRPRQHSGTPSCLTVLFCFALRLANSSDKSTAPSSTGKRATTTTQVFDVR